MFFEIINALEEMAGSDLYQISRGIMGEGFFDSQQAGFVGDMFNLSAGEAMG